MTEKSLYDPDPEIPFDFRPPYQLSLEELRQINSNHIKGLKIETEQGIKTAEELLNDVRDVVEEVLRNPSLNAEQKVKILPKCLHTAVTKCILAARKSMPTGGLSDDRELEGLIEALKKEGLGIW